jgi:hypothetical protein
LQVLHTDSKYNKDKILKYLICEHYLLSIKDLIEENYYNKKKKILQIIKTWQKRDLTLYGKLTIIKSLITSIHLESKHLENRKSKNLDG